MANLALTLPRQHAATEGAQQTTGDAWRATVPSYKDSQREMAHALKTSDREPERFLYHRFHDNYHIGQIMQVRAMQDLPPIA